MEWHALYEEHHTASPHSTTKVTSLVFDQTVDHLQDLNIHIQGMVHEQPVCFVDLIIDHAPSRTLHFSNKDFLIVPQSKIQFTVKTFSVTAPQS